MYWQRPVVGAVLLFSVIPSLLAASGAIRTVRIDIPHAALYGLAFEDGNGFAVGADGKILESTDRGETWADANGSTTELAYLSVASGGGRAIAVGQAGLVAFKERGGKWELARSGTSARLLVVATNKRGLAFAAGEFGTVLRSNDGGRSWAPAAPDWSLMARRDTFGTGEPSIYAADVDEEGAVTLAGEFGVIVRSHDGGATWTVLRAVDPKAPTIHGLLIRPSSEGNSYAVGQKGEILISGDGGGTWSRCDSGTNHNFNSVAAAPGGSVVITGMRVMYRSPNAGMSWIEVDEGDTTTDWYQTARLEPQSGRIYAVGHSGKIIQIGSS